jgi:hypothetical protein
MRRRSIACTVGQALSPAVIFLLAASLAQSWTMSVEFPYHALPRSLWERELAHLKEMGVTQISLPLSQDAAADPAQLDEVIRIIRRLGIIADLEGPIPERLQTLAKSHGGPLTEQPPGTVSISAIMPRALDNERKLLLTGTQAIIWTDVFETLNPAWKPGAITLAGAESPGAAIVRREARLTRFWGAQFPALTEAPGARLAVPVDAVSVRQYIAEKGLSLAAVTNESAADWKGEIRVLYPALQRPIGLPAVAVQPWEVLWLPVDVPLADGPLCSNCSAFAPSDHLAYATAELTGMEYENGILAMEFIAPTAGEAVLQLSHEPTGPLVAGGHPSVFEWDPKTLRARLPIPAGNSKTGRVRVALAMDAPPATALFDNASVLLIGETNRLTAQFSPPAVAVRSRLRTVPELTVAQITDAQNAPASQEKTTPETTAPEKKDQPALIAYKIAVPATAIPGDTVPLTIEADGAQLSHAQPRLVPPAEILFGGAVSVRVAAGSVVSLSPATIPVNQKQGREMVLSLRNNATEIRTFDLTISVPGLEFSPEKLTVSVGASVARDITFRVFSSAASAGIHEGEVRLSGAAALTQPVRFVVLPATGAIAWSAEGFSVLESAKSRATFLANRWLEMIDKESGTDSQPAGGSDFTGGLVDSIRPEALEKLKTSRPAQ